SGDLLAPQPRQGPPEAGRKNPGGRLRVAHAVTDRCPGLFAPAAAHSSRHQAIQHHLRERRSELADIGLVTDIGGTGREISSVGTEGYMAPEGPGTAAADVYSLG